MHTSQCGRYIPAEQIWSLNCGRVEGETAEKGTALGRQVPGRAPWMLGAGMQPQTNSNVSNPPVFSRCDAAITAC